MSLRYEDLIAPRLCDEEGAAVIVKKLALFRRMVEHHWIAPVHDKHACRLFAVHQVHACCDLIDAGYVPGEKDPEKATLKAARDGAFRPRYFLAA
ncbi:MAG: hypothetical protein LC642_05155 [Verrucomicrobiaceae bacterium]|nr:hypothetical protein [Verrucomicrobiaceae bacterium]